MSQVPNEAFFYPNLCCSLEIRVCGVRAHVSNDFMAFCAENRHYIDVEFLKSLDGGSDLLAGVVPLVPPCTKLTGTGSPGGETVIGMMARPLKISAICNDGHEVEVKLKNVLVIDRLPVPLHVSSKGLGDDRGERFGGQFWMNGAQFKAHKFPPEFQDHPYWTNGVHSVGYSPAIYVLSKGHDEAMHGKPIFERPCNIRFTQASIKNEFKDGRSLMQTVREVSTQRIEKRDIEMVEVVKHDGKLWSLSNRRLAVFRLLEMGGCVGKIKVRLMQKELVEEEWKWKFDTENNGTCVLVRGTKLCVGNCEATTTFPFRQIVVNKGKGRGKSNMARGSDADFCGYVAELCDSGSDYASD